MVLPGFWWLLSIYFLSWCCDVRSTGILGLQSEPRQLPVVLLYDKEGIRNTEDIISIKDIEKGFQMAITGIDIISLEIGKNMEDMEAIFWNPNSQLCQILAKDPKLQQGYITVVFFYDLYVLSTDICSEMPRPLLERYDSVSARNLVRDVKLLETILEIPVRDPKTNPSSVQTS